MHLYSQNVETPLSKKENTFDSCKSFLLLSWPYKWFSVLVTFRKQIICALLIFVVSVVGHMRALKNGYVLDDFKLIVCNDFLSERQNAEILLNPKYLINPYPVRCGARPLTILSLLFDYKLWHKNPFGYHLTNILLHALTSVEVFFLVILLLRPLAGSEKSFNLTADNFAVAIFASLIFAFHPVQSEAVNIASFRADLLAAFLYILSLILFIKAVLKDKPGSYFYYFTGFMSFVLGLFAKENVITLTLIFPLYLLVLAKDRIQKKNIAIFLAIASTAVIFIMFFWRQRFSYLLDFSIFPNMKGTISPISSTGAYVNTIVLSFLHYFKTILLPMKLSIDYELGVSSTLMIPEVFVAAVIIAAFLSLVCIYKNSLFRFGLCFCLVCYLPVSNIFPLINTVNDRYMYIPMAGFSIALAAFVITNFRKKVFSEVTIGILILAVITVVFGALTIRRNVVFDDGFSLYSDAVKTAPTNVRVRYNLAVANMIRKNYMEAIKNFEIVRKVNPLYMRAEMLYLIGMCHNMTGDIQKAKYFLRWSITVSPSKEVINSYASILAGEGDAAAAAYLYNKSMEMGPDPESLNYLGIYYASVNNYDKAMDYFKQAVGFNPGYINAWANMAKIAHNSKNRRLADEASTMIKNAFLKTGTIASQQ